MQRLQVIYKGRVQGVGFRFTVQHIARGLNLTGWVRNNHNGSVEVIAEGEPEELNLLLERTADAFASYISSKEINWLPATGEFRDFAVTH